MPGLRSVIEIFQANVTNNNTRNDLVSKTFAMKDISYCLRVTN